MNFNTGIYNNAVTGLTEEFQISAQAARVGSAVFLIAYAFGSELWAPWSEEFGRWPIMQISLFLVNIWQLPCALAPNYGSVIVARVLGGVSSAGGSVTLAMVADMWEPDKQDWAVAFVVFSSVAGSSLGPIIGPFIEGSYLSWRWIFWVQLIFGGFVQALHLFTVPETRSTIILDREAKRRRRETGEEIWGPNEITPGARLSRHQILVTWARPFEMFFREPIVLFCSLLSGFSDALIFTFIESFSPVYEQWGFTPPKSALTFVPIWIGYILGYASYYIPIRRNMRMRLHDPKRYEPEKELTWLLLLAPLEPLGLFIFAWTSFGPSKTPWIAPMIASAMVGIANYSIYESTIQYMMLAYGPYSASATGGNALARDGLAGIATMYATPLYDRLGNQWATTLLALLAVLLQIPIFWFKVGIIWRFDGRSARAYAELRLSFFLCFLSNSSEVLGSASAQGTFDSSGHTDVHTCTKGLPSSLLFSSPFLLFRFANEIMEDRKANKGRRVISDDRAEEGTEWRA